MVPDMPPAPLSPALRARAMAAKGFMPGDEGDALFAVDHHRGSEENQAGWDHHDPTVVDERTGLMDTLPTFRATIRDAGLEDVVIAVVGQSPVVAAHWSTPLSFVFIDGGHGQEPARLDYEGWS